MTAECRFAVKRSVLSNVSNTSKSKLTGFEEDSRGNEENETDSKLKAYTVPVKYWYMQTKRKILW